MYAHPQVLQAVDLVAGVVISLLAILVEHFVAINLLACISRV